jgi:hypothetical protein
MNREETGRPSRGLFGGVIAGVVGIGCCVGPAVAALMGITSAAIAIDAGVVSAEGQASALPPVRVTGPDLESRVSSALDQVASRYSTVELSIAGLSRDGVLVKSWWVPPQGSPGERYYAELKRRSRTHARQRFCCYRRSLARTPRSTTSAPSKIEPSFPSGADNRCSRPAIRGTFATSRASRGFSSTPRDRAVTSPSTAEHANGDGLPAACSPPARCNRPRARCVRAGVRANATGR